MTKYKVQWDTIAHHTVEVEAENEDEAYDRLMNWPSIATRSKPIPTSSQTL